MDLNEFLSRINSLSDFKHAIKCNEETVFSPIELSKDLLENFEKIACFDFKEHYISNSIPVWSTELFLQILNSTVSHDEKWNSFLPEILRIVEHFFMQCGEFRSKDVYVWWKVVESVTIVIVAACNKHQDIKNAVVHRYAEKFLTYINTRSYYVDVKFLCSQYGQCVDGVDQNIKNVILNKHSKLFIQLASMMLLSTNYSMQSVILEFLLHWLVDVEDQYHFAKQWFPRAHVRKAFCELTFEDFTEDCKRFLSTVKSMQNQVENVNHIIRPSTESMYPSTRQNCNKMSKATMRRYGAVIEPERNCDASINLQQRENIRLNGKSTPGVATMFKASMRRTKHSKASGNAAVENDVKNPTPLTPSVVLVDCMNATKSIPINISRKRMTSQSSWILPMKQLTNQMSFKMSSASCHIKRSKCNPSANKKNGLGSVSETTSSIARVDKMLPGNQGIFEKVNSSNFLTKASNPPRRKHFFQMSRDKNLPSNKSQLSQHISDHFLKQSTMLLNEEVQNDTIKKVVKNNTDHHLDSHHATDEENFGIIENVENVKNMNKPPSNNNDTIEFIESNDDMGLDVQQLLDEVVVMKPKDKLTPIGTPCDDAKKSTLITNPVSAKFCSKPSETVASAKNKEKDSQKNTDSGINSEDPVGSLKKKCSGEYILDTPDRTENITLSKKIKRPKRTEKKINKCVKKFKASKKKEIGNDIGSEMTNKTIVKSVDHTSQIEKDFTTPISQHLTKTAVTVDENDDNDNNDILTDGPESVASIPLNITKQGQSQKKIIHVVSNILIKSSDNASNQNIIVEVNNENSICNTNKENILNNENDGTPSISRVCFDKLSVTESSTAQQNRTSPIQDQSRTSTFKRRKLFSVGKSDSLSENLLPQETHHSDGDEEIDNIEMLHKKKTRKPLNCTAISYSQIEKARKSLVKKRKSNKYFRKHVDSSNAKKCTITKSVDEYKFDTPKYTSSLPMPSYSYRTEKSLTAQDEKNNMLFDSLLHNNRSVAHLKKENVFNLSGDSNIKDDVNVERPHTRSRKLLQNKKIGKTKVYQLRKKVGKNTEPENSEDYFLPKIANSRKMAKTVKRKSKKCISNNKATSHLDVLEDEQIRSEAVTEMEQNDSFVTETINANADNVDDTNKYSDLFSKKLEMVATAPNPVPPKSLSKNEESTISTQSRNIFNAIYISEEKKNSFASDEPKILISMEDKCKITGVSNLSSKKELTKKKNTGRIVLETQTDQDLNQHSLTVEKEAKTNQIGDSLTSIQIEGVNYKSFLLESSFVTNNFSIALNETIVSEGVPEPAICLHDLIRDDEPIYIEDTPPYFEGNKDAKMPQQFEVQKKRNFSETDNIQKQIIPKKKNSACSPVLFEYQLENSVKKTVDANKHKIDKIIASGSKNISDQSVTTETMTKHREIGKTKSVYFNADLDKFQQRFILDRKGDIRYQSVLPLKDSFCEEEEFETQEANFIEHNNDKYSNILPSITNPYEKSESSENEGSFDISKYKTNISDIQSDCSLPKTCTSSPDVEKVKHKNKPSFEKDMTVKSNKTIIPTMCKSNIVTIDEGRKLVKKSYAFHKDKQQSNNITSCEIRNTKLSGSKRCQNFDTAASFHGNRTKRNFCRNNNEDSSLLNVKNWVMECHENSYDVEGSAKTDQDDAESFTDENKLNEVMRSIRKKTSNRINNLVRQHAQTVSESMNKLVADINKIVNDNNKMLKNLQSLLQPEDDD